MGSEFVNFTKPSVRNLFALIGRRFLSKNTGRNCGENPGKGGDMHFEERQHSGKEEVECGSEFYN